MNTHTDLPLAISAGDPAGVGPELVWRAVLQQPEWAKRVCVVGHLPGLRRAQALFSDAAAWQIETLSPTSPHRPSPPGVLRVVPVAPQIGLDDLPWGQVGKAAGQVAAESVQTAAGLCLTGQALGLVTAPIHKQSLDLAGVPFPGHTEMLQQLCATHLGVDLADLPVRMMLATPALRTVLVSIHVSLRQAIDTLTPQTVLQTLRITHAAEMRWRATAPRIAVAGLNPHAGEGGLMGREEIEILAPAIHQARLEGLNVSGPHPPDTVFMRARHAPDHPSEFDVVLAMYHDQGLIPIKYLGLDDGVNVTLGLPMVRTSPDHGTAFDLAGTGLASPGSLLSAWRMARQMTGLSPST